MRTSAEEKRVSGGTRGEMKEEARGEMRGTVVGVEGLEMER